MITIALLLPLLSALTSPEPYRLGCYPQKIRTIYPLTTPAAPERHPYISVPIPGRCPIANPRIVHRDRSGAIWVASSTALARHTPAGAWEYFAGRRYLAPGNLEALLVERPDRVWIRSEGGFSRIDFLPMGLEDKAARFEERVRLRHDRYGLVADSELTTPGDLSTNRLVPSDNDGLWTALYLGAECYRYAVSAAPEARAAARRSLHALLRLEEITGQPGFPARSYIRKGDYRPWRGVWRDSADGEHEWKADTSSDELVGHFFAYTLYYDLVAEDEEKPRLRAAVHRIMTRLLDDGYNLVDRVTGKPTTWGEWSPAFFSLPRGREEVALNSTEMLSHLLVAHHITGDPRFLDAYHNLISVHGYARNTARYLDLRSEINYSDEELALLSFYPLFLYERNPSLRGAYLRGLDQWWQNCRRERNPLWIFIYQQATGTSSHTSDAVWTLARYPMDLIKWTVENSSRADITWDSGIDRFRRRQIRELLPPDERPVQRWNSNVFRPEGGSGGRSEDDGAAYLLPYWMGRYHRFITE